MAITAAQVAELRTLTGAGLMDCKKALEESAGNIEGARDWLRKKGIAVAQKKSDRATKEGAVAMAIAPDKSMGALVRLASETDFVARNDEFKALIGDLAAQVLAKGTQDVPGQTCVKGSGTVREQITAAIAKMGENLQFMDAGRVEVKNGVIGGYVHSNAKIGVLVALKADGMADPAQLEPLARDIAMHVAASQVTAVSPEQLSPEQVAKEKEILIAQAAESGKPKDIVEKMVQGRLNKYLKEITLLSQPFVKDPEKTVEQLLAEAGKALGAKLSVEKFVKLQF
jgi:elongation factor Ts